MGHDPGGCTPAQTRLREGAASAAPAPTTGEGAGPSVGTGRPMEAQSSTSSRPEPLVPPEAAPAAAPAAVPATRSTQGGALLITGPSSSTQKSAGLQSGMAKKHPLSILLVEDNLVNQRVACRMLSHMGYTVDVANNGLEAIKALEKKHYDLVFMDIQMPVMDGIEATQRIHSLALERRCSRPRIVAMTANVLHSDRQQCLTAGMDGFLSKPIRVSDLVAALEQTSLTTSHLK